MTDEENKPSTLMPVPQTPVIPIAGRQVSLTPEAVKILEAASKESIVPVGEESDDDLIKEARTSLRVLLEITRDKHRLAQATPREIAYLLEATLKALLGLRGKVEVKEQMTGSLEAEHRDKVDAFLQRTVTRPARPED